MKYFLLTIALMFVSACNSLTPNRSQEILPMMPPTGSVAGSEFVSMFTKICLANFPNNDAIIAAFKEGGFSITSEPRYDFGTGFYSFASQQVAIDGSAGSATLVWSGPDGGGAEDLQFCELQTELINPETIDNELAELLRSQGDKLEIEDTSDTYGRRSGSYENLEGIFRFSFDQARHRANSPEFCNGLEECRRWGKATLRIDTLLR